MKPNLVLINAGSNDCNIDSRALNAKDDMESLIKAIFDDVPGVSVVLSTLAPSDKIETCAEAVSQQYRDLVPKFTKGKIALADFYSGMDQKTMMHPNDLHPNDVGYKFMASIWWDAITKIQGNFKAPLDNGTPDEAPDDSIGKKPSMRALWPFFPFSDSIL